MGEEEAAACSFWWCWTFLVLFPEEEWQWYMMQKHPSQLLTRLPPPIFFSSIQTPERKEKKIGNTFLAQFTCLTFCLGCYNSTCKSPTSLYEACCYPSLGRHQTLEVATEYFFWSPGWYWILHHAEIIYCCIYSCISSESFMRLLSLNR